MNRFAILSVSLLLAGQMALAKTSASRKPSSASESVENYSTTNPMTETQFRTSVGPSLGLLDGNFGWGLHADFLMNIPETPAYVGLQTGYYHFSNSTSIGFGGLGVISIDASTASIPVLASGYYRIPLDGTKMSLYGGLSLGVSITRVSASASGTGVTNPGSQSNTSVDFEGLLRPGLEIPFTEQVALAVEAPMGIVKGKFAFLPHAAAQFAF